MYVVRWKWAGLESSVVAQADTYAYQVAEASFQHTFTTANNMCDIWAEKCNKFPYAECNSMLPLLAGVLGLETYSGEPYEELHCTTPSTQMRHAPALPNTTRPTPCWESRSFT